MGPLCSVRFVRTVSVVRRRAHIPAHLRRTLRAHSQRRTPSRAHNLHRTPPRTLNLRRTPPHTEVVELELLMTARDAVLPMRPEGDEEDDSMRLAV